MANKFKLQRITKDDEETLNDRGIFDVSRTKFKRLVATRDFGDVNRGDLGGIVELSRGDDRGRDKLALNHEGRISIPHDDHSWIHEEGVLLSNAFLDDNSVIRGNSIINNVRITASEIDGSDINRVSEGVTKSHIVESSIKNARSIESSNLNRISVRGDEEYTSMGDVFVDDDFELTISESSLKDTSVSGLSVIGYGSDVFDSKIKDSSLHDSVVNHSELDYVSISGSTVSKAEVEFSTLEDSKFENARGTDLKMKDSSVDYVKDMMRGGRYDNAHIMNADDIRPYSITNSIVKGEEGSGFPTIVTSNVENSKIYGKSSIVENSFAYNSLVVDGALYESSALDATIKGSVGMSTVRDATVENGVTVDTMGIYGDKVLDFKGVSDERDDELSALEDEYSEEYDAIWREDKSPKVTFKEVDLVSFTGEEIITLTDDDLIDLDESDNLQI